MALTYITPTKRLRPDAAASYKRMRADGMPSGVTSAHRSSAYQFRLWNAYRAGKGNFALHPDKSNHVKGIALDLPLEAREWIRRHGAKYGWTRVANEPWHFDYNPSTDAVAFELRRIAAAKAAAITNAKTRAAARVKVAAIQKILGTTPDGIPGTNTQAAWDRLTRAAK